MQSQFCSNQVFVSTLNAVYASLSDNVEMCVAEEFALQSTDLSVRLSGCL